MDNFKEFVLDEIAKSDIDKDDLFNIWIVNFNKHFIEQYNIVQNKIDNLTKDNSQESIDKIQLLIWQLQDYYTEQYRWCTKDLKGEPYTLSSELIKLQRLFKTKLIIINKTSLRNEKNLIISSLTNRQP
jgi:hypothetical protein